MKSHGAVELVRCFAPRIRGQRDAVCPGLAGPVDRVTDQRFSNPFSALNSIHNNVFNDSAYSRRNRVNDETEHGRDLSMLTGVTRHQ